MTGEIQDLDKIHRALKAWVARNTYSQIDKQLGEEVIEAMRRCKRHPTVAAAQLVSKKEVAFRANKLSLKAFPKIPQLIAAISEKRYDVTPSYHKTAAAGATAKCGWLYVASSSDSRLPIRIGVTELSLNERFQKFYTKHRIILSLEFALLLDSDPYAIENEVQQAAKKVSRPVCKGRSEDWYETTAWQVAKLILSAKGFNLEDVALGIRRSKLRLPLSVDFKSGNLWEIPEYRSKPINILTYQ